MEIIDQTNREIVLYFFSSAISKFVCVLSSFSRGYFGVGSGTHYMYF